MSKHAIVAALAAVLALVVPTSASAFKLKEVGFDVAVKGVQTVKWEQHQPAGSGCDVALDGSGTEVWRFETAKPVRMKLSKVDDLDPMFFYANQDYLLKGFPLRSKVTRQGEVQKSGNVCSYGDGSEDGQDPQATDCGTVRTNALRVGLAYHPRKPGLLVLKHLGDESKTLFENCPEGGISAPRLLTYKGQDDQMNADVGRMVPARDLFNRAWQKHIIIAGGTYKQTQFGTTAVTTIRWEVTLTRHGARGHA